jgi:type II secretory pathway pseudopilin PulG
MHLWGVGVTESARIVAAVSAGALLALAAMLAVRYTAMARKAERDRRVELAVRAVLGGVETLRRESDRPPEVGPTPEEERSCVAAVTAAEVQARAHLRLVVTKPRRPRAARLGDASRRASSS